MERALNDDMCVYRCVCIGLKKRWIRMIQSLQLQPSPSKHDFCRQLCSEFLKAHVKVFNTNRLCSVFNQESVVCIVETVVAYFSQ